MRYKSLLVTGGAGFIGSAFIRLALKQNFCEKIINLDLLTYAGNLKNLPFDPRHIFIKGDINDTSLVEKLCGDHSIDAIIHFAAESHVDRSILDPLLFAKTNVLGTLSLLEAVRKFPHIHFHHVSTDEVFGSIEKGSFRENSPYSPSSPYSASKAASDHFVRAYATTYHLSATLSYSSNNYGPYQYPEKFIPLMISHCLAGKSLPIYGEGLNVRDWLYVDDHAEALLLILQKGVKGQSYAIGGGEELRNIDLIELLIEKLGRVTLEPPEKFQKLITFIKDRPGHDLRYALDCNKIKEHLGWTPRYTLAEGLNKTLEHYVGK